MKTNFLLVLLVLILSEHVQSQAPGWEWAKKSTDGYQGEGNCIAADASGNIIVAGAFLSASMTFGNITLNAVGGGVRNFFIAKYDPTGNVLWAKTAVGNSTFANAISIDGSGNTYVTGSFNGSSLTFDAITIANAGSYNFFIVKYDVSGNALWARSTGGDKVAEGLSIAADAAGNVYVTGMFTSDSVIFGNTVLTNADTSGNNFSTDGFIAKYNSTGTALWAIHFGGIGYDYGRAITSATTGEIYVAGSFGSNSTFQVGSFTMPSAQQQNMFLAKIDLNGNVLWANGAGPADPRGLAMDPAQNIYLTGGLSSAASTFGNVSISSIQSYQESFIVKYDTSGNALWGTWVGATNGFVNVSSITAGTGAEYVTGYFQGTSITLGNTTLTSPNQGEIFVAGYDDSGNFIWAVNAVGCCYTIEESRSITTSNAGDIYITGLYDSISVAFGSNVLDSMDGYFIAKLSNAAGIQNSVDNTEAFSIFPNPVSTNISLHFPGSHKENAQIEILNSLGEIVFEKEIILEDQTLNPPSLQRGIYFVRIKSDKTILTKKIVN